MSTSAAKIEAQVAPFICPITQKEMNGHYRFVYGPCGCVLSEQALKEVQSNACLVCGKVLEESRFIPLNSTDKDELAELEKQMQDRKARQEILDLEKKAAKKLLKSKRKAIDGVDMVEKKPKAESSVQQQKGARINLPLPNLKDSSLLPVSMRVQTEAVKSLFVKKDKNGRAIEEKNQNFLVRGTFNRSAASF